MPRPLVLTARSRAWCATLLGALIALDSDPAAGEHEPYLVRDIDFAAGSQIYPYGLVDVDGVLFFGAGDAVHGTELWRSDGTTAGTVLVRDIWPGIRGSSPGALFDLNGVLYFAADDGTHGLELWKSDGTAAGTVLVSDIVPGTSGSDPNRFVSVNGTLFFTANDGASGTELWKSDGTAAGTVLVLDIRPGALGASPQELTDVNGTLFFTAAEDSSGREIWKSDGTAAGTVLVRDIWAGGGYSSPKELTHVNGMLFFTAEDSTNGRELWKSDGTAAGTVLVRDIKPGTNFWGPESLTGVNGTLFFAAEDGTHGGLWKSDGTAAGTVLVRDIYLYSESYLAPQWLTDVNGTLFFSAFEHTNGHELWKSDGTTAGTVVVSDINPGPAGSNPGALTNLNGTLFFDAYGSSTPGRELWKSDGTTIGTVLVRDIWPGAYSSLTLPDLISPVVLLQQSFTGSNSTLFLIANDGTHGVELWKSDGTAVGTALVRDIWSGTNGSTPYAPADVNGTLFFAAMDDTHGVELWKSDGTFAGTVLVRDIWPGAGDSLPQSLTEVNGVLFFTAEDGIGGRELWKSDGTTDGTVLVADIRPGPFWSFPEPFPNPGAVLTDVNGTLFFAANDGTNGTELWKSDGTAAGTVLVRDIRPGASGSSLRSLTVVNGTLFFMASDGPNGTELWKSDGTFAGTVLVRDIWPGASSSFPLPTSSASGNLTDVDGTLFFTASDGTNGMELWKSDGTTAGTVLVRDIQPGANGSGTHRLANVNGTLFLSANDGTNGLELWKSDGTSAGTVLVRDIQPGVSNSFPFALTSVNGTLYFRAGNSTNGTELWKSDGTFAGTVLVRDIWPGVGASVPQRLTDVNGTLFFTANDGTHGAELWKSDGTAAGTFLVHDIRPGADGPFPDPDVPGFPLSLSYSIGTLFFSADDGVHGAELWALTLDSDDDGLSDRDELALGTDPLDADSDGDGVSDGAEVAAGVNPLDPGRFPVALARVGIHEVDNPADGNGLGSVAHEYSISQHEVTVREYVSFLNAVADTDTNGLYEANPAPYTSYGILRSGSPGSYVYSAVPGRENTPVNLVSFYDAMRFVNWLHNGQPEGNQNETTTEDGAYTITPTGIAANSIVRNLEAAFVLPSEDEWYKAAHYDAQSQSYLDSPAGSVSPIACAAPGATPNTANCGFSVGDTADVGSYPSAASPSGTYDQGGNVWEWTDSVSGTARRIRGGGFESPAAELDASGSYAEADPQAADPDLGFRVVPETDAFWQVLAGVGALIALHKRRRGGLAGNVPSIARGVARASARAGSSTTQAARVSRARDLRRIEQAVTSPAEAQEPGVRRCDRRGVWHRKHGLDPSAPTREPTAGRRRIDPRIARRRPTLRQMASRIHQHICQRMPYLARRAQHVHVVTICEHAPSPLEDAIDGARDARADRLHAARELALTRRLGDQMHVVRLDRVVNQSEASALACGSEAALERAHQADGAQRRQAASNLQRHVAGEARSERRARAMRMARVRTAFTPGAVTATAPARSFAQIEAELPSASRHGKKGDMRV